MITKHVYLDYAASTPPDPEVIDTMISIYRTQFGNPSSLHEIGTSSRKIIENSRQIIANSLNTKQEGVIFTGGGTEADNLALQGILMNKSPLLNHFNARTQSEPPHMITTVLEHSAIYNTAMALKKRGYSVSIAETDSNGLISPQSIESLIRPSTVLISVQYVNNELGTIQPIKEIAQLATDQDIYFHTDAIQAYGKLPIDLKQEKIDLISLAGHKIYGPKGVGALVCNTQKLQDTEGKFDPTTHIEPIIFGGTHEKGLRPSTENTPVIAGMAKAVELAEKRMEEQTTRTGNLRDYLIDHVLNEIPDVQLNGDRNKRIWNNANFSFKELNGYDLLLLLDTNGIAVSTGSACASKIKKPSRVLTAIGLTDDLAHASIRMTLGAHISREDIDYVLERLPKCVKQARLMYK